MKTLTSTQGVGKPEGKRPRDHSEDLGVDRKIILEWILRK
jgi:hypothetical protein